jgi:DHA1 family multidrug resistance protein-like MFS transporter
MEKISNRLQRFSENLTLLKGNLLILILSWMLMNPVTVMLSVYEPLYIKSLGASTFIVGSIYAVSTIILSIVRIPGGYIADRYGRKKIIVFMTFGVALSYLFYAYAPSWGWILVGAIFLNFCLFYQPALLAIRADSVPPEKRGTGFALADFFSWIVSIPAPLVVIYLVSTLGLIDGMRVAYLAAVSLGVCAALLRLLLNETLFREARKFNAENFTDHWKDFKTEYSDATKFVLKTLPVLVVVYILCNFAFWGCWPLFSIFAVDFLAVSQKNWGLISVLANIVYVAIVLPVGILLDKIGRKKVLLPYIIVVAVSAFLYATTPSQTEHTILFLVVSFPFIMFAPSLLFILFPALEADLVSREKRGRVTAVLMLLSSVAGAAGQVFGGIMYEQINPRFPFLILGVFATISFFIILLWVKEPSRREV